MDEAAAKLRMERDSLPEEMDEIERKLKQLEIEREAIKREKDEAKLAQLNKEIADLKEQDASYKAKWQSEKALVNKIQENKKEIEQLKFEADRAEREGNYGRVAEIRYGKLQALEAEIKSIQDDLKKKQGDNAMIKEEVTAEDIADDLTAGDRELIVARSQADLAADQGIGAVDGDGSGAFGESNIAENNSTVIESQTVCSSGSPINGITACGRGCQVVVNFLPLRRIPHLGKPELQIVLQIPARVNRAGEIVQSDVGSVDADCGADRR